MLRRPATTLTLSKEEVTDLINHLQEKTLEERLKTEIPKQLSKSTNENSKFNVRQKENERGVPVGLWKNSPLKSAPHSTRLLDQLNISSLENHPELQNLAESDASQEENPFYQPEQH